MPRRGIETDGMIEVVTIMEEIGEMITVGMITVGMTTVGMITAEMITVTGEDTEMITGAVEAEAEVLLGAIVELC